MHFRAPRCGQAINLDESFMGVVRLSREAPVLILHYDATQVLPGGAEWANNVSRLVTRAALGLAGRDEAANDSSRARKTTRKGCCGPPVSDTGETLILLAGSNANSRCAH